MVYYVIGLGCRHIASRRMPMKEVTVASLMQLDIFKENLALVAGEGGLGRSVVFVTVQEAQDFADWLDGGEFVLSTWFAFANDRDKGIEAFRKMADNVAALAIKVPRFIDEIPQEILEIADERNVPVFTIKRAAKFREIIRAISVAINSYQSSVLNEAWSYYNELSSIAVDNASEQKMLEGLAKRIDLPCFIVETSLTSAICSDASAGLLKEGMLQTLEKHLETKTEFPLLRFRLEDLHVFPCASRSSCYCYVVALSEDAFTDKELLMCNQLCTFLTIKRQERAEVRQKGVERLFLNFILNDSMSLELASQEFVKMGLDVSGVFQAGILSSDAAENSAKFLAFRSFAADFCRILKSSVNRMEADRMIFLIGHGQRDNEREVTEAALALLKKYPNQRLCLGPRVEELPQLRISYQFAMRCLHLAPRETKFVDYSMYAHWLAVLAGAKTDESEWLVRRHILPLAELDKAEQGMILSTLEVALFSDSISVAAEKLSLHVNSVRYRLRKVREVTGLDFFSPVDRCVLFIAYLMYKGMETVPV